MNIIKLVRSLVTYSKEIDVKILPSQGLFYPDDFKIKIKKVTHDEIKEYEEKFDDKSVYIIINLIKKIIKNNVSLSEGYNFTHIKSVDIIFLFLEIVKWTKMRDIIIPYFDEISGEFSYIEFNSKNFNYFDYSYYIDNYNKERLEFIIDGYRLSFPSIGLEDTLTEYLIDKSDRKDFDKWNHYSYDFLYFLGNKNTITFDEIDNLITVFNYDLEESERLKTKRIVEGFSSIIGYSLKKDSKLIEIKSKLDLSKIWQL